MRNPVDRELIIEPEEAEFYEDIGALTWGFANTVPGVQGPRRLGADRNGTAVYVPLYYGMALAKIDINTHEMTRYPLPIAAHPYFVVVDKNSMVWTNLMSDDRIARFDPVTEEYTLFKLPTNGCESRKHRRGRSTRRRLGALYPGEQDRPTAVPESRRSPGPAGDQPG